MSNSKGSCARVEICVVILRIHNFKSNSISPASPQTSPIKIKMPIVEKPLICMAKMPANMKASDDKILSVSEKPVAFSALSTQKDTHRSIDKIINIIEPTILYLLYDD